MTFLDRKLTHCNLLGGLLAAAIHNMDGIGGKPGWAWIFILEGLFTVLCAAASFFILEDFPETAKFLSETERTVFATLFSVVAQPNLHTIIRCLGHPSPSVRHEAQCSWRVFQDEVRLAKLEGLENMGCESVCA